MKAFFFQLIPFLTGISCFLGAAYYPPPNYIDSLKIQLSNQEAELDALKQKLENFHVILESLQQQLQEQGKGQKEELKKGTASLDIKIAALENMAKSLAADLKQLQAHANETATSLQAMKQKLGEQNGTIENLQSAIQTLIEALQVKLEIPVSGKTYKVKAGDSLEKIARAHGTTIQAIKNINGMSSDKIVVGKTLLIPE